MLRHINKRTKGFTLIELMIIMVVIAGLSGTAIVSVLATRAKARDAERKSDLQKMASALEVYYNDNACYPAQDFADDCGGTSFQPYLREIACDPQSAEPYDYVPLANPCKGYRLYANLENENDPQIESLNCNNPGGCGYGLGYNYGVAVGTTVHNPDVLP